MTIGEGFDALLGAAQTGAAWAFQRLYEDLSPPVHGYLAMHGASEPEDLASEVFLGVFRRIGTFSGDESDFRSWVFTIAHRRLVDERRHRGRRPEDQPLEEVSHTLHGGDVEDEALGELGDVWVREALSELTDAQREVVLLRVIAGLSAEEVAEVLGKRPGAVRAQQHRAVATLRRALERGRISHPSGGGP